MAVASEKHLKRHIDALCTRISSRMIGTPGDHESARYVEAHFRRLGLEVLSNTMPCYGWDLLSTKLEVAGKVFPAIGNMYSPAGTVTAPLVLSQPDITGAELRRLAGKVVAVYGDFSPFPSRLNGFALKAEAAGVSSVVVIDSNHTTSATKLIRELRLKRMPVMSVSMETGLRLAKLEGREARCTVKSRRYGSTTRDVIGVIPGGPREICMEAHRDAAPDTPSADDNGSGSAVLLELARLLAGTEHRHTIRFVSATAEEFGNVGTPVYARKFAAELKRIDLMINVDSVGGALCPGRVFLQKKDGILPLVRRKLRSHPSLKLVLTDTRTYSQIGDYLGSRVHAVNVVEDWANQRIHTVKDNAFSLSFGKLAEVTHFLLDLIVEYDRRGIGETGL